MSDHGGCKQHYGQGAGAPLMPAHIHNGVEFPLEFCLEGVDGEKLIGAVRIVEGQLTLLIV